MKHTEEHWCTKCDKTSTLTYEVDVDLDELNQQFIIGEVECPGCKEPIKVTAELQVHFGG